MICTIMCSVGMLQEGLTSLMVATQSAHLEVVEALLEATTDPDITDNVRGNNMIKY